VAVRLTAAPLTRRLAEHVPAPLVQLMLVEPAVPLTVPPEEPTVNVYVGTVLNVAVAVRRVVMLRVQAVPMSRHNLRPNR